MKVNVKTNKSCIELVAAIPLKKIGMIEKQRRFFFWKQQQCMEGFKSNPALV